MLDAQPGLAAATTRRNQEDAAVTKVAATAAEDARLQREMIAGLQLKITELSARGTTERAADCRESAVGCRETEVPAV